MGGQCAKPERHRHATKDARPCGLHLGPLSAASRLLAVPDPSTSPSPLLAATRPEAQRGSREVLLEALKPRRHPATRTATLMQPVDLSPAMRKASSTRSKGSVWVTSGSTRTRPELISSIAQTKSGLPRVVA